MGHVQLDRCSSIPGINSKSAGLGDIGGAAELTYNVR